MKTKAKDDKQSDDLPVSNKQTLVNVRSNVVRHVILSHVYDVSAVVCLNFRTWEFQLLF